MTPVNHQLWISTKSHFHVHLVATRSNTNLLQNFLFILSGYFNSIIFICNMSTFLLHPPRITVKIIGMDCSTHGMSCYAHHICGSLLTLDVVICFEDSSPLTIGFLKRELTKFSSLYEGMLAQVSLV